MSPFKQNNSARGKGDYLALGRIERAGTAAAQSKLQHSGRFTRAIFGTCSFARISERLRVPTQHAGQPFATSFISAHSSRAVCVGGLRDLLPHGGFRRVNSFGPSKVARHLSGLHRSLRVCQDLLSKGTNPLHFIRSFVVAASGQQRGASDVGKIRIAFGEIQNVEC